MADVKERGKSGICKLGAKNKNLGFLTNHLRRSSALRLLILPIMDMNCLHFLLTEQRQSLHKMLKTNKMKAKS